VTDAALRRPIAVVLVHHADAVGPHEDAARPLSERGRRQAEQLAAAAALAGIKPAAIWHSGKLRARQTAEAFWRHCNPFAEFKMVRGLRPEDSASVARDLIEIEDRDLLLVSHMPLLPELARALRPAGEPIPLNGLIALERTAEGLYVERWRRAPDV
jgi:phosphohistidine phosphatase